MNNESLFGEVIYAYTRKQAVADGFQVDVTATAQEAGIRFPVFLMKNRKLEAARVRRQAKRQGAAART
ncbi:MAG TPA: hypothetical protein VGY56_13260 [Verrucomicrobiae bacterium]|nr:hypothetical protein [Verrucomicrobiae bacterium]